MKAAVISVSVCALLQVAATIASAQSSTATGSSSLERVSAVAAVIQSAYCDPDLSRVYRGAISAINALPERSSSPQIVMRTNDFEGFSRVYADLLEVNTAFASIERAALNGMTQAFFPENEYKDALAVATPESNIGGIGLELDGNSDTPLIVSTILGGPAARAGILAGDQLVSIGGQPAVGRKLADIVALLRGAVGTSVPLIVKRDSAELSFSILREVVSLPPVSWRVSSGVGVIDVRAFTWTTAREVRHAILSIRRQTNQPVGYVLDLRNNSGGYFDAAIETIDVFVKRARVLVVRPVSSCRRDRPETFFAKRGDETENAPLVVLVNANTASGAELVAASLREVRQARLVGQPTYGNAEVYTAIPVRQGQDGYVKLRTGIMSTPSGASFDAIGLVPDVITPAENAPADLTMATAISMLKTASTR
jgi:carboxyl-terminal processing protease